MCERYAKVIDADNLEQSRLEFEAQLKLAQGDYDAALQQLLLVRQLSGDPDDFSIWIGRAYLETGQPTLARQELTHSLARYQPFDGRAYWLYSWYYLGRAHEELGNRGGPVPTDHRLARTRSAPRLRLAGARVCCRPRRAGDCRASLLTFRLR